MFESSKPKYMSKAVSEELSDEHLHFIINYLDDHAGQLEDYLQVFKFYIEEGKQWVIQRQEVPERETTIYVELQVAEPIHRTVWVFDEHDHVVLMFKEDY